MCVSVCTVVCASSMRGLKGYCLILCRKHAQSQGGENSSLIKRPRGWGAPGLFMRDEPFVLEVSSRPPTGAKPQSIKLASRLPLPC